MYITITSPMYCLYSVNEAAKVALTEEEAKEEAKRGVAPSGTYVDVDSACAQLFQYVYL